MSFSLLQYARSLYHFARRYLGLGQIEEAIEKESSSDEDNCIIPAELDSET